MLAKGAVENYLNERVEDFTWVKEEPLAQLQAAIREVTDPLGFEFKTKPYRHQLDSFFVGLCNSQWLYYLDMGLGKTKVILDLITLSTLEHPGTRYLVVVPSDVNLEGWEEEVALHSDLSCTLLEGSSEDKMQKVLDGGSDLFVVTYPGLLHLCSSKVENKKKGKMKMKMDPKKIRKLNSVVDGLILDEVHKVKNSKSVTFSVMRQLVKNKLMVYGLTGTPFGKDPIDLWSQFFLIDGGDTFGTSAGFFREIFYIKSTGFAGSTKYTFDVRLDNVLTKKMRNGSLRYRDKECQDLPSMVEMVKRVQFDPEAYTYYLPVRDGLKRSQIEKDYEQTENNFTRLRELCSGFTTIVLDDGTKHKVEFDKPAKIEMLRGILEGTAYDTKVVIFHNFVQSGRIIEKLLMDMEIEYVSARGETRDKVGNIRKFKDPKSPVRVLIANANTAGVGGNFQRVSNRIIFYESPLSPIVRKQCIKRVYRGGQARGKVFITDIIVQASVEEKILESIREGENLFHSIVNNNIGVDAIRVPLIHHV